MREKKNKITMIIAGVILLVAVILCFTIFNNKGTNNNPIRKNGEIDYNDLLNMVPMVQRANYGLYHYNYISINDRTVEEKVIGALNHINYTSCRTEETKDNCIEISVETLINEIKKIYNIDITKEEIEKANENIDKNGIPFYTFATLKNFQVYHYKDDKFICDGYIGFVNANNMILKYELKDNNLYIYENVYYLSSEIDSKKSEIYEILYDNYDYKKEIAREKINTDNESNAATIDLTKYTNYATTFIHTFVKNGDNYYYSSSTVDGLDKIIEEETNVETNE